MSRSLRLSAVVAAVVLVLSGTSVAQAAEPTASFFTPTTQAGVAVGVPVIVTGTTLLGNTAPVTGTELTFDGGATWVEPTPVELFPDFRIDWSYLWTPTEAGTTEIAARPVTTAGPGAVSAPIVVHVGGETVVQPVNCSVRCEMSMPFVTEAGEHEDIDDQPVEVGVRVRVDRPGVMLGASTLRGNYRGTLVVRMWADGVLLAEQPYDHPGRMVQADFATPVPVEPGREYVVSFYSPQGGYMATEDYFTGTLVAAPFIAPHDGVHGAGVYHYGVGGGFPTDTYHDSSYSVLPEFRG
ncbi:DUF4082 domain-containing protein [Saccharothrix syringae]|uniref:DUF4082 domain-containing protein n=1 Tax=Saccharothrix syringae TaxID=103733 RepID=A0A5Q0H267_SACSY|nr:DUF4082 domain-containing protein [Saccharothrix syringae]QFZ20336.1 DUF4082 domain-containing protein [Saccharothrix syringae]